MERWKRARTAPPPTPRFHWCRSTSYLSLMTWSRSLGQGYWSKNELRYWKAISFIFLHSFWLRLFDCAIVPGRKIPGSCAGFVNNRYRIAENHVIVCVYDKSSVVSMYASTLSLVARIVKEKQRNLFLMVANSLYQVKLTDTIFSTLHICIDSNSLRRDHNFFSFSFFPLLQF